ncbi:hypothetical protein [Pedobacter borealis]|uniref:hypothetical protein n=1 Tax=Pedobacter borealis TaxID=475254 RepID=UPI0004930E90|nr:hypothetical protein [Pedobacter borealis]
MKKIFFILIFISVFISSNLYSQKKITDGLIFTYHITYKKDSITYDKPYVTMCYKGDMLKTTPIINSKDSILAKTPLSMIRLTPTYTIINTKNRLVYRLTNENGEKIALKSQDFVMPDSSSFYNNIYTKEYKVIAGYNCRKVIMQHKINKTTITVYITAQLNNYKFYNKNVFGLSGVILEYDRPNRIEYVKNVEMVNFPNDYFTIPKDYMIFETLEEFQKFKTKQFESRMFKGGQRIKSIDDLFNKQ